MAWWDYSLLAAFISLFIAALMHMVSRGFGLQHLGMWVKAEYVQVAVSFVIVLLALSLTVAEGFVTQISTAVAMQSGNLDLVQAAQSGGGTILSPAEVGRAYLRTVIECEQWAYRVVWIFNVWFESWSRVSYDIIGVEASSSNLSLSAWVSLFHYIGNNMIYFALFNYIQYYLLHLAQYAMLFPFLPAGLALRAFAPTRGAGGLVTAFALGFAFVFPMSYVVVVALMPSVHGGCTQLKAIASGPGVIQTLAGEAPCFTNTGLQFENYFKIKKAESSVGSTLSYYKELIGLLFLQSVFYPLVCLTITFTFIRQTSSLFGADLAEIGRGLLKII